MLKPHPALVSQHASSSRNVSVAARYPSRCMEDSGVSKRTRQACEPCRRKKSRCPCERPICSYCRRIGQTCLYRTDHGHNSASPLTTRRDRQLESRMSRVENKLDLLLDRLEPSHRAVPDPDAGTDDFPLHSPQLSASVRLEDSAGTEQDVPDNAQRLMLAGRLYWTWCHKQPLALFRETHFLEQLSTRDLALQLAIQALGLRFPPGSPHCRDRDEPIQFAVAAREQVLQRIASGRVELSCMQALCLLVLIDFGDGRFAQAALDLSLAGHLAANFMVQGDRDHMVEYQDCVGSIHVLRCLHGAERSDSLHPTVDLEMPHILHLDRRCQMDSGIMQIDTRLSRVWTMAQEYARTRPRDDNTPPWMPQSDFAAVMTAHMRVDSLVPERYRYSTNDFRGQRPETLQRARHYWAPWLAMQIMYAAIPCLINHPYLLSMRLRGFRSSLPQSFIQQSYEQISRHLGWIMHWISLVELREYDLIDPVLAHCTTIVATLHLQHSFVDDDELRQSSVAGFDKCMRLIHRIGTIWPAAASMAKNLRDLHGSIVVKAFNLRSGVSVGPKSWSIDTDLLGRLLVYDTAALRSDEPDLSLMGTTLVPKANHVTQTSANEREDEYDLIGGTGISRHRTAPRVPINAPEDEARMSSVGGFRAATSNTGASTSPISGAATFGMYTQPQSQSHSQSHSLSRSAAPDWSMERRILGGLGGPSIPDHMGVFFPANEYGRAIDDWFGMNTT